MLSTPRRARRAVTSALTVLLLAFITLFVPSAGTTLAAANSPAAGTAPRAKAASVTATTKATAPAPRPTVTAKPKPTAKPALTAKAKATRQPKRTAPLTSRATAADVPPADCTALTDADLASGAAPLTGTLPAGDTTACYGFPGTGLTSGDLLRVGGVSYELQATVYDSTDTAVCSVGQYGDTCQVTGTGPFRMALHDTYAQAITYSVTVFRVSHPTGCATLSAAPFGDPGSAVATGTVPVGGAQCRTIALPAGPAAVSLKGGESTSGSTTWTLYTAAGEQVCAGTDDATCGPLAAAGTYTLLLEDSSIFDAADYTLAVVPLTSTSGCAATIGTSYGLPVLHATLGSPVQTDCQPFQGTAGERVDVSASTDVYGDLRTTVVGPDGLPSCTRADGEDGCVLTGTGPYRVINSSWYDFTGSYRMRIGRMSDPVGCTALAPQVYGTAPTPSSDPCWQIHVTTAGTYDVAGTQVYRQDGTRACQLGGTTNDLCTLTAGTYTLLFRSPDDGTPYVPVFISRTATTGCVAAPDTGFATGPYHGTLTGPGERGCLLLPTASNAGLYLLDPGVDGERTPFTEVVDALGLQQCNAWDNTFAECALTGQAPFRVLTHGPDGESPSDTPQFTGKYTLLVNRTTASGGCTAFPQSAFGDSHGADVTLTAAKAYTCLSIPANSHGSSEMFDYTNTKNSATANVYLADASGREVCASYAGASSTMNCKLTPGTAYTAVMLGNPGADSYQLVHRDVSAGAKCAAPASTTVGGAQTRGTLASKLAAACVRVTTASAADRVWLSTAATGKKTVLMVTDAQGNEVCWRNGYPCVLTGSTSYQAVIIANNYDGTPFSYRLDSWRLVTGGAFPSQCRVLTTGPAGFGPLTGSLDAGHPAICATVPVKPYTLLNLSDFGTDGPTSGSEAHVFGTDGSEICSVSPSSGHAYCSLPSGYAGTTAMVLINLQAGAQSATYGVLGECVTSCVVSPGTPTVTAVGPATAPTGSRPSVVVTGTGFRSGDTVWLTQDGSRPIAGTVTSTSGTTLHVTFNLNGAAQGTWTLRVASPTGAAVRLADAFTVTPPTSHHPSGNGSTYPHPVPTPTPHGK